ncbi:MAG TPA: CDP-alcohol phosphatidyltransferase family protein [Chitinophagaceae bacterium]|nr:CDP-alcohol phosphatidyltransferase family protein [Chitinophagaceae bacterium]
MKLLFKNLNLPDWLSFYRVAAFPFLLLLVVLNERSVFSWFLLVSYATDAVDGMIARRLKITSARGAQLDSLGDQLTFIAGIAALFVFETTFMKQQLGLLLLAFSPYLLQLIIAYFKYGKATAFHTYLAKLSAIIQSLFILILLFFGPVYWLFYSMLIIGLLETIEEIALIFMYDKWVSDVKGIFWAINDPRRKFNSPKHNPDQS